MRCNYCGWQNPESVTKCERCGSLLGENTHADNEKTVLIGHHSDASSPLHSTIRESVYFPEERQEQERPKEAAPPAEHFDDPAPPSKEKTDEASCPQCGYPVSPGMNICPNCGASLRKEESNDLEKTQFHHPINKEATEKRQPIGKTCPKCGNPVSLKDKFCPSCGAQLRMAGTINSWDSPENNNFFSLRPISWAHESLEYKAMSFSGERIILNRANTDPNNQSITSREQAVITHEGDEWFIEDLSEKHTTMLRVSRKTKLQPGDVIALGNRLFEFND